ncbi:hypothetical protein NVP1154O_12 [Vibrio phage 1.154.O._10N.222.52.B12]|nr:hypothetical protein NVP1154O_12 [Vibrio phage 1.154.O._10N.222.52.B12]
MKDKKLLGFRFLSTGEASILTFFSLPIYKRAGSAFSIFGVVFHVA